MSRALRNPRTRLLLTVLVGTGVHAMAMVLGLCMAIVAGAAALVVPGRPVIGIAASIVSPLEQPRGERVEPSGRHPPDEGIHLRH